MDGVDENVLSRLLMQEGLCGSTQEAEAVLDGCPAGNLPMLLRDYFGADEATSLLSKLQSRVDQGEIEATAEEYDNFIGKTEPSSNDTDTEEFIGPGECALCERYMKLTRHHLIPKSTWNKVESRFHRDEEFSEIREKFDLLDVPLKTFLGHYTADVCRRCHAHIHSTFPNWDLAVSYNSLDKLLSDDRIYKYAAWASKQRTGKNGR